MKNRIIGLIMAIIMIIIILPTTQIMAKNDGIEWNGHEYKVFNDGMTWTEAKEYCESLGGYLACVTDENEQDFIVSLIKNNINNYYWLGGTDSYNEGNWEWISGEPWNYSAWGGNNPDDYSGEGGEDYLGILSIDEDFGEQYTWNDFRNDGSDESVFEFGFICEWDNTDNHPDITTNFEVNKYRAEYLMNNTLGSTMENYYFNLTNTPSHIFFNAGIDSGLYTTTSAWDGITKLADGTENISKLADYTFEKKDLYSAIIFKIFQSSTDYKLVETLKSSTMKDEMDLSKDIISIAKDMFNFDVVSSKKIADMTYDEKSKLQKASERLFKQKYIGDDYEKYVGIISSGINYAEDIEEYFELLADYTNIRQLNDSIKQVMKEMHQTSTDNDMKAALSDCIRVMNASDKDFVNQMAMAFAGSAGKGVVQYMVDKMWDVVTDAFKAYCPAAYAFKAAYDAGKLISNALFNTDEISEKYLDMEAVVEAEDTLKKTYNNLKSKYKKSKTESNAGVYNSAIDIMFNLLDADCDYARDFADSVGSSAAGTLNRILGNNGVENRKKEIDSIQRINNTNHEEIQVSWIFQLQEDDYSLYEQYKHLLNESFERIKKRYNINCPVDVYIYNSSGGLAGSVVDNRSYCSDENNLTMVVEGDKKTVYFYDDNEYDIRYVGNDTGTMDISVTEYDDEQNETRKVNFNDIALENGTEYTSTDSGSNMSRYVIKDEYSGNINSDFDSQNAGGRQYTVKLNRGYFSTFDLSKQLYPGENPEITAYVPDGYEFVNWESNIGEDIFDDADSQTTTICMPSRNVEITATIEKRSIAISDVTSSSVTVQTTGCARLADGTIILAAYDNSGALQHVDAEPVSDRVVFSGVNGKNYNIKAMLWDSVNGMMPLVDYADKKTPAMPSTPTPAPTNTPTPTPKATPTPTPTPDVEEPDFDIVLDKSNYSGGYYDDIPVEIITKTPDEYVEGSHKYILWIAYLDGYEWQQCATVYVDGGTIKWNYDINAADLGIPTDKDRVTFAFSLFGSDYFVTGGALVDKLVTVNIQ